MRPWSGSSTRRCEELGSIDILVNNAGIFIRHDGDFSTMPLETWHGILDVNLHGVFHCTRAVLRHMIPRKAGGKIVNISSILARTAHFEASSYHVSKGGIESLTRCLAVDLAPHKINVNAIGPGGIATEGLGSSMPDEVIQAYRQRIPWGARGRPKDIGNVVAFLASEEAGYITGQVIYVDGGYLADSTPEGIQPDAGVEIPGEIADCGMKGWITKGHEIPRNTRSPSTP